MSRFWKRFWRWHKWKAYDRVFINIYPEYVAEKHCWFNREICCKCGKKRIHS